MSPRMPLLAIAVLLALPLCGCKGTKKDKCKSMGTGNAYRYVSEVDPQDRCLQTRDVRVAGTLVAGSHRVRASAGGQEHRFELTHSGKKITVRYQGPFPRRGAPGGQLVVKGRFAKGVFVATEILHK